MQVQDLYKLLHQAALGSEHAIPEAASARRWLERELIEMGPGPDDPLLDPISPGAEILRVHLRPYIQAVRDPQALLTAFLRTADGWPGSQDTLRTYARIALEWSASPNMPLQPVEIQAFFATMEAQGYPAVHHSEIYASLYRPAYRVVAASFLEAV